jgi:S-adenosylmethionine:tRNA ribosyltransferase-isomerase
LSPKDCLVLNDSRVIPARLVGYRTATGGHWEGLFLSADNEGHWRVLGKARGRLAEEETVTLVNRHAKDEFRLRLLHREPNGVWLVRPEPLAPEPATDTWHLLERAGRVPLPHYIRQGEMVDSDVQRYQTVFAAEPGSVAAPTAGLHFTNDLLTQIQTAGTSVVRITLHVGLGTFRPVVTEQIENHQMHFEAARISDSACQAINRSRASGGRIVAVGTTTVRTLESAAMELGEPLGAWSGTTNLFIQPNFVFRIVDALITNFHLPRSTLLILARTFGGDELIRRAYDEAVQEEYRFFSYGDAMFIV